MCVLQWVKMLGEKHIDRGSLTYQGRAVSSYRAGPQSDYVVLLIDSNKSATKSVTLVTQIWPDKDLLKPAKQYRHAVALIIFYQASHRNPLAVVHNHHQSPTV